jgi:hypothetical protein
MSKRVSKTGRYNLIATGIFNRYYEPGLDNLVFDRQEIMALRYLLC